MDIATILNLVITTAGNLASMAGVAAFMSAVVEVLKSFGVVTDGNSGKVFAGMDLFAIVALVAVQLFAPQIGVSVINVDAGLFATVILLVLSYLGSIGFGKATHSLLVSMNIVKPLTAKKA